MTICAWRLSAALPPADRDRHGDVSVGVVVFLVSAVLAAAVSFMHTAWACLAFVLNAVSPAAERYFQSRRTRPASDASA